MPKKKRKTQNAPSSDATAVVAPVSGVPDDTKSTDSTQAFDLDLVTRAVQHVSSQCKVGMGIVQAGSIREILLEALQPIIVSRVNKYQEDSKETQPVETGKFAVVGVPSKKRQLNSAVGNFDVSFLQADVGPAVKSITYLAQNLEILMSKQCKPLRAALHPLVEAHLREENASPAFRITCMLGQKGRWNQALPLLAELRDAPAAKRPKLGAYMRWVRELDVAVGGPPEFAMLDAIMRTAAGFPRAKSPSPAEGSLKEFPPFSCGTSEKTSASTAKPPPSSYADGAFHVLSHEAAHERKPPNKYDLDIYTCSPGVLALNSAPKSDAARHAVPGVAGAFALSHVLSKEECASIRNVSEAIGYRPDVPLSSSLDDRAHNVVLMASEADCNALFARVKDLLPPELEGDRLLGLNRRWRLYRYLPGNVYRKHLDGAWPASGTKVGASGEHEYVYDAHDGKARSRLTFVLYLSGGFEGGATTFFVPNPDCEGVLEARPVQPQEGFATVFVHGETGVPLLHEGSPVVSGTKYILRTDVVYESSDTPEARQEATRLRGLVRQVGQPDASAVSDGEGDDDDDDENEEKDGKSKKAVIKDKLKNGKVSKKHKKPKMLKRHKAQYGKKAEPKATKIELWLPGAK